MRFLVIFFLFFTITKCVLAKNNVKSLTESQGQEIIEIGGPDKGLPADLEEEPSAELEDEEEKMAQTSTTLTVATKKEAKKTTTAIAERRMNKNNMKIGDDSTQDEEELRIEKELAEIYKDNSDYKGDSSEATMKLTLSSGTGDDSKPLGRNRPT
ncbi:hypothetical protein evm_008948 [Chilo suppressalis]|nr:hypothetical protein evm_008948 [Chilo suppressalis]